MTTVLVTHWLSWAALAGGEIVGPPMPVRSRIERQIAAEARLTRACRRQGEVLRGQLGDQGNVYVDPPFVLGGDLSREQLVYWDQRVVRHAAEAMWRQYFTKRPTDPIVILLFGSERDYRRYARRDYGETAAPYYGYCLPEDRRLVMNITTGGGTLVHELTHALIDYDFPCVPDWFNEGLACLHEECEAQAWGRGALVGRVNWRLPALQQAMASGKLRPLRELMTMDDFRGPQETLNYAQARYFCMYVQTCGALARFYKAFRDGYRDDHTGLSYVEEVMGRRRLETIEREFLTWVRRLRYPP